jgi:type I restriction enzyme S subunit
LKAVFATETNYQPFGTIAESRLGKMLDQNKNKGELQPYLRNINVRWFDFDLNDLLEMRFETDEDEKYSIVKGDLVICEGGEPGRCAIWKSDETIKYQKALHRVRPKENLSIDYLLFYLRYLALTGGLEQYFTGTGIKHLTGESLRKIPVPLPPLPEQQEIVRRVEQLFALADSLEAKYQNALRWVEKLEQAVLAKAFRGELAEADAKDESAEVLLERIRAGKQGGDAEGEE